MAKELTEDLENLKKERDDTER
jgi:hypothetical protein